MVAERSTPDARLLTTFPFFDSFAGYNERAANAVFVEEALTANLTATVVSHPDDDGVLQFASFSHVLDDDFRVLICQFHLVEIGRPIQAHLQVCRGGMEEFLPSRSLPV